MKTAHNIVLSGGGTRGYAHIGILKALFERGIVPKAICGASSGALVAAFICDGFHPLEIEEIVARHEPQLGFNFRRFWSNVLTFRAYTDVLQRNLRSTRIENMAIPLHISVTNLQTGLQEILSEGNVIDALCASAAIPALLPHVTINSAIYADGGLSNNLPVEPFLSSGGKIIGSHVNPLSDYHGEMGLIHAIDRTMHLLMHSRMLISKKNCDVFIEPPLLKSFHLFESKRTWEIIGVGYDYAMKQVDLSPLG